MKTKYRMKLILAITILLGLHAQMTLAENNVADEDTALVRVVYKFKHVHDTLNPDKPHREEMSLLIGRENSKYESHESYLVNKQLERQMNAAGFDGNIVLNSNPYMSSAKLFFHKNKGLLTTIETYMGTSYDLGKQKIEIDWKILDETEQIDGYSCQKAVGEYGGRAYTVWFTTETPFMGGPWKLQGLPGLILQAEDSKQEVKFTFAGIETLLEESISLDLPEQAAKTDKKSFEKLKEALKKNPQAAMSARNTASRSTAETGGGAVRVVTAGSRVASSNSSGTGNAIDPSKIKSISVRKDGVPFSKDTNNPLELKEVF